MATMLCFKDFGVSFRSCNRWVNIWSAVRGIRVMHGMLCVEIGKNMLKSMLSFDILVSISRSNTNGVIYHPTTLCLMQGVLYY